jgi:biotin operon repressor
MNEQELSGFFDRFDNYFKAELKKEVLVFGGKRIDYTAKKGNRIVGIEVKGSRANIYNTIGQLFFMKTIFSDLYLLAPLDFIKKLSQITEGTPLLDEIGLITLADGSITVLKHPVNREYYYKQSIKQIKQKKLPKLQYTINENDIIIIKLFKNRGFTAADLSKELNISRENAYRRIARLKKAGVIRQIETGVNPKSYKVVRYVEEPEFIVNT